jgi:PAP2 superfamily protein
VKIFATLLPVATVGSMVLTEVLKRVFQRARPELFDSGYYASGYSFPSDHATLIVGFYGTLALLLTWRLEGFRRWTVATAGVVLVLLIGLSPHVLRRPLPGGHGRRLSRGASLHARPQGRKNDPSCASTSC